MHLSHQENVIKLDRDMPKSELNDNKLNINNSKNSCAQCKVEHAVQSVWSPNESSTDDTMSQETNQDDRDLTQVKCATEKEVPLSQHRE